MNRLAAAALTLCAFALALSAQTPSPLPTFRDRHQHGRYYRLYAPSGLADLELQRVASKHGAVSGVRYETAYGLECETFVSDGHIMSGRLRHSWLHRQPQLLTEMLVPEANGALLTLPVVPYCPVLTAR